MFFNSRENNINDLYKELQILNNKLDFVINQNKINQINATPLNCQQCPNHPSNGGSGICHCILGTPKIT